MADVKSDRRQALDLALASIDRQFGKGAIMRLGQNGALDEISVIPTGALALDAALGIGGIPRGRVTEIYGPESSGKTTLALHVIAEAQRMGGTAAFIDAEHALDPIYAKNLGVNTDELLISQPDTGEQALEIAETLVRSNAVDVIVIDSVAALVPRAELDGDMGDSLPGLQARLMSQALRKLTAAISRSGGSVIFINQIREKIGVMFGSPETTTGGRALKFYASIRLDIRRQDTIKNGTEAIGVHTKVKVVKNKLAPPFREAEFDVIYGEGISKEGSVLDAAAEHNVVEKSGTWYTHKTERIGQGRENAKRYLKENPKLLVEIEAKVRAAMGLKPSGPAVAPAGTEKGGRQGHQVGASVELQELLTECAKRKASDLHLKAGSRPILRIHGHLEVQDDLAPVSHDFVRRTAMTLLGEHRYGMLMEGKEMDVGYLLPGLGRFRVNMFLSQGEVRGVFRHVPQRIPAFQELHMPKVLDRLCMERRGLILVTGITGSGKSTTLAAIVDFVNKNRNDHIITIEDPIEFVHEDNKCVISQREIGQDSVSFATALRAALREDPDIILVGEMRDAETMEVALHAAETGHLVLSTLHTLNATETVNRIISTFPPHQEDQIRDQLASVMQGIVSQRLVVRADGKGRVPAVEVMVGTGLIRDSIRSPRRRRISPPSSPRARPSTGCRRSTSRCCSFTARN